MSCTGGCGDAIGFRAFPGPVKSVTRSEAARATPWCASGYRPRGRAVKAGTQHPGDKRTASIKISLYTLALTSRRG